VTGSKKGRSFLGIGLLTVVSIFLVGYFAWAAVNGSYGLMKRMQIEINIAEAEQELAEVTAVRLALENKVRRLSDDFLDLDLLDERARHVLGYIRSDEIIVQ